MKPLDLAFRYMDIVFAGDRIDNLSYLLADKFTFCGPFYEFNSAESYINSLKADPPVGFNYSPIATFEDKSSACLIYQFSKPGISVPMAQIFQIANGKISNILLIFDTGAFT